MQFILVDADLFLGLRTGIFAEGRFLGKVLDEWINDCQEFLHVKMPHLVMVAIIAVVLVYLLRLTTAKMVAVAVRHSPHDSHLSQVKTLAGVIRATGLAVIGGIVGLQFLAAVGVNLAPLLTSAGIAGVAVGLAAQNIVRDMFNGILILIEDQFGVGDTVRIAGVVGVVEAMTLRKTSVRDNDGTLYVIPNSQITTVANQNREYSLATAHVSVDFSANPDKVIALLKTIAMEVRESEEFAPHFVEDPKVLGVDAVKGSEMIFAVVFKTLPLKYYAPVREFRRRVRVALGEQHLLPGDPNRIFGGFGEESAAGARPAEEQSATQHDPTLLKPQESNPFAAE